MSKPVYLTLMFGSVLIWVIAIVNLLSPFPGAWATVINTLALVLLVAHAGEIIIFKNRLGATGNPKWQDALLILIGGVIHASYLRT